MSGKRVENNVGKKQVSNKAANHVSLILVQMTLTNNNSVEIVSWDLGFLYNHISSSWMTRINAGVYSKALKKEQKIYTILNRQYSSRKDHTHPKEGHWYWNFQRRWQDRVQTHIPIFIYTPSSPIPTGIVIF